MSRKRYTQNEVEKIFKERGCELLSEYKGLNKKVIFKCKCGNISEAFSRVIMKNNSHCKKCGYIKSRNSQQFSLECVKQHFKDNECELLEDTYINARTRMKYKCNCGNISNITLSDFKSGNRCGCKKFQTINSGSTHCNWNPDREYIKLRKKVNNKSRKLVYRCLNILDKAKLFDTEIYLGYTRKELIERLQSFSQWNELKNTHWHLDHIFPIKAFVKHDIIDLKIINSLDNLQPLSQFDNLSKNDKYNKDEFIKYLNSKGISIQCQE